MFVLFYNIMLTLQCIIIEHLIRNFIKIFFNISFSKTHILQIM